MRGATNRLASSVRIPDSPPALILTFNSIRGWINISLALTCLSRKRILSTLLYF